MLDREPIHRKELMIIYKEIEAMHSEMRDWRQHFHQHIGLKSDSAFRHHVANTKTSDYMIIKYAVVNLSNKVVG